MAYDLNRFIKAQQYSYADALQEIRQGKKRNHWMWYIFPQIKGLGRSDTAVYYSIANAEEAKAYLENDLLRKHLLEIGEALLSIPSNDAGLVMGWPDDMKLKSSMTLFAEIAPEYPVFQKVLDKYFTGEKDQQTLQILKGQGK